ncbi:vacuolar protein sorting/targeting protein PEP1 [Pyricularia oryzae]|uniref:Vacuolar protein sorting/targeting protein 10 n=2 Tax=Pyricularia TaxID=48558 RepID=A0ABQ8P2M7_PYRGI|nr:vacuolar protein sorting/targeting protein PEP1 [Pyricularia oryzae]KAI6304613.1 vacuolar protein sorting/targeting protein PEP1 [Pyricularia grisea]KAH9433760.1 vacuolar protein sorting/targeting protein PEP1 [Pyricularia oryzae]KAI6260179.1 vacuolar protein sorting/targeting protein PEP1 [Pyricularia oryzae]KAI6276722.1 vacuolar protein sorting/targeting protein PEP1 [Pyricularia oryzae]
MRLGAALQAAALLTASLWSHPLLAASDDPAFKTTKLDHYPFNLNYFEDSDIVLYQDEARGTISRSEDAGATWTLVKDIEEGKAFQLVMHPFDRKRAYVLTSPGIHHFRTHDQGRTWQDFLADTEMTMFRLDILSFHATDPDRIIFNGMDCKEGKFFCEEVAMYTTDGFTSDAKFLRGSTSGCSWAKSSKLFTTGQDDLDKNRILCVVRDHFSPLKQDQRLMISDNFFSAKDAGGVIQEFEPNLDMTRPIQGVVNVAVVKKYLLVAASSMNTDEMSLFVSDDTLKWHRAMFPTDHKINQESYTVLESTEYSIQVDVMTTHPSNPMGVMYTSNSNGTFFTRNIEHTNRNHRGHVDFEKITGVQGIFMVNKVDNAEEVEKDRRGKKKIVSEITFDDGRTFEPIHADKERLHLHSVTELINAGRVFSSPAPGLVMGNGNTGKHLESWKDASLYISDDAGLTWIKGPNGPHKYEFGDQGSVLLAVRQAEEVDEVKYSLNHGKDWKTAKLPDDLKVKPIILTTTQDSTSLKFILIGEGKGRDEFHIVAIDFSSMHEATCKDSDMEDWYARVDDKGKATCLMGHTQKYRRRKKDADCFVKQEFKDPVPETKDCECSDQDFECDYNFKRDGKECVLVGTVVAPDGACKNAGPDDTFKGSSGWRLIPGNTCKRASGAQKDDLVDRKCKETSEPTPSEPSGNISTTPHNFSGDWLDFEKHYLEKGAESMDENEVVIARPINAQNAGQIFLTKDHGKTWHMPEALKDKNIWGIVTHQYFKEMAFFVQDTGSVIYTVDHGEHFHDFKAPGNGIDPDTKPLVFHPDHKDWMIWIGKKCEENTCYREASFSQDRGDNWKSIARYVYKCEFTGSSSYKFRSQDQIICSIQSREGNEKNIPFDLVSSNDLFKTSEVRQKNIKDFATMAEFIVVAAEDPERKSLKAFASLDGDSYAATRFPSNLDVKEERAFTVLDSSTHAVKLFVPSPAQKDRCVGSIAKSNSNGTDYVVSITGVNCDENYFVDFEKMLTLEGVILVNIVANRENTNEPKKRRSLISHSDGATWSYLPPPRVDAEGKNYPCTSSDNGDENCALHIHGYTERKDHGKTYSSAGAVGLMFGVGNVGSTLGDIKDADTFLTTDAGISWKSVKKGAWRWAYGDQGSILMLVPSTKTKMVSYTTDEGETWNDHNFTDEPVDVLDMTTVSSGGSRNFLLWCRRSDKTVFAVNLDLTGLANTACKQVDDNDSESDYYAWSPSHPLRPDDCLFGHKSYYLRKKTDRKCYNKHKITPVFKMEVCECTREDFECDYNYELEGVGRNCVLAKGAQPMSREDWCSAHPKESTWYEPSGFRRIPISTCKEGRVFDNYTTSWPCPGHEEEYERQHGGPGGFTIFLIVILCVGAAGAVGVWVHRRWESGGFGQIRLGEQSSSGISFLDPDSPWVRYPVVAVSATVALVGALPLLVGALWRTTKTTVERWGIFGGVGRGTYGSLGLGGGSGARRFTTRDSFARGRSDYAGIDEDEGELLGDDSDEEV